MSGVVIVTGTDTGIGKTVVAAGLAAALGAYYWKPIQAGTKDGTDSESAQALGVPAARIVSEAFRLTLPASPHLAARHEGVQIDPDRLALPPQRPLVVEGAGGLMVPIRRNPPWLMIDQFANWQAPVILVARTSLGTINHSLLSLEALKLRAIPVIGILFSGGGNGDVERAITGIGGVPSLGHLPILAPLDAETLAQGIACWIDLAAIRAAMGLAA